jgi:predicted permease
MTRTLDAHKVRRLSWVLVASQMRSGRTTSDPKSFTGRPALIAVVDVVVFLVAFLIGWAVVGAFPPGSRGALTAALYGILPFLPLAAVGVVVVAGTMFELTGTARFAGSDAVNWMPVTPGEYVAASANAIAFSYSPAVSLLLGGTLAVAITEGALGVYALAAVLTVLSLFEGGLLVEMIRAVSNRAGAAVSGRKGSAVFVLRALLLVVVILTLDLALNPVFLFAAVGRLSAFPALSAAIPFFWSSHGLSEWISGQYALAAAFAVGQVAFVVVLGFVASRLRVRYWVPVQTEIELGAHQYAGSHATFARLGLSGPESALVAKDLRGLVRRRELLPALVVPVVLILLLLIEGHAFGVFGTVLWVGWVTGFFGLLLSAPSVGQERRSVQLLFAFPITPRTVFRAKFVSSLLPVLVGSAAMALGVGLLARLPPISVVGLVVLSVGVAVVLTLWGLVFASRYADFQDRPRPQFVRPAAMVAATISGVTVLMAMLVPGAIAVSAPSVGSLGFAIASVAIALAIGVVAYGLARSGFDTLFREVPF